MKYDEKILAEIKDAVKCKEPSAEIYLYGSRARDDDDDDSDWDLLILLDKERITPDVEREITYPLFDLEFEYGEIISPSVYSRRDWYEQYKLTSFYKNVMSEGKLL